MKKFTPHRFFTLAILSLFTLLPILPQIPTDTHAQVKPGHLIVLDPLGGGKFIGAIYTVDPETGDRAVLSNFFNTAEGTQLFTGNNIALSSTGHLYLASGRLLMRVDPLTGFRTVISSLDDLTQGVGTDTTFNETVTPAATTGAGVPFEASDDIFLESDVGALIVSGTSQAVIVSVEAPSIVLADIISDFPTTDTLQPSQWFLLGPLRGRFNGLAVGDDGQIYATSPSDKLLLSIDETTGFRTIISRLGDLSQGPTLQLADRLLLENSNTLLLLDGGPDKIVRLDLDTGLRSLVTQFGDASQGPTGTNISAFALEPSGDILVTERFHDLLFRVDPTNGFRTVISDFNDLASGPVGRVLEGVTVNEAGQIFVVDSQAGGELLANGAVFEVDGDTGMRRIASNFGDNTEGLKGFKPSAITVALPVSPTPEEMRLVDTVLLATEAVELGKGAVVSSGNVITNSNVLEAKVTAKKKARTAQGFEFSGNVVVLEKGATVGGDVVWNQRISNKGQILGEETRSAAFPIFPGLPRLHRAVTGDAIIVIKKKGFLSLPAGRYKNIIVEKGAQLILEGGVYEVENFTVNKKSLVAFDGPVEIRASKGVSFAKKSAFRATIASNLDARSAVFYTEGNFDASKGSLINASIIGPLGTVQFGKSSRLNGFAFGRRVVFEKGAVAALKNFLENSIVTAP